MATEKEVVQRIRERVNIADVVGQYVRLERRGDRLWGLSPFKTEKTPSFTVQPEKGFFYCFATRKGGDVFTFLMEVEGLSFPEALERLAPVAGIQLESAADDPTARERAALLELYKRVSTTFRYLLLQDPRGAAARAYLTQRAVSPEVSERFMLGYAPDEGRWLYQFLRKKSYTPEFLARSGFFSRKAGEFSIFRHRLMFPIANERHAVVAFGGRALGETKMGKYINSPETAIYRKKETLFGLSQAVESIRKNGHVYLVEGNFDVLAMHQAGITPCVAPLGTAFTQEQAHLLRRWAKRVILVFDADEAGIEASLKAAHMAEQTGLECMACHVPSGKDPADLLVEHGGSALTDAFSAPRPIFDHLLDVVGSLAEDAGKRSDLILRKLFPYISIVGSEVGRERYLAQLADYIHASVGAVRADFDRWTHGEGPERTVVTQSRVGQSVAIHRELALMLAVAQDSGLFAYLRTRVTQDDLTDKRARAVYVRVEDAFRHGEELPQGLLTRIEDEGFRNLVLEKLTSGEFAGITNDGVEQAVRTVQMARAEQTQREIERALRTVDNADVMAVARLMERKIAVDQELRRLKGEIQ